MYVIFDIGATNFRIATSLDGKSLTNKKSFETPKDFSEALKIFEDYKTEFAPEPEVAVGGLPGFLNSDKSEIIAARNLPTWENVPIYEMLAKLFNCKVYLQNDANLAALGEAVFGLGASFKSVAYITISTGVGAGFIQDQKIIEETPAYEFGREQITNHQDLESLVSGKSLEKKYQTYSSHMKDPLVLVSVAKYIAKGLELVVSKWHPDLIVLGGGVIINSPLLFEQISKFYYEQLPKAEASKIIKADLGDDSGLFGALAYAKQNSARNE